ncbi:MAG: hypothetical protein F7B06_01730 [Opitutae bacterium]|nr:hypothetical protein [Opitutae bacterium]MBC9888578.1 hypothetical protein [Opitutae bacterium]
MMTYVVGLILLALLLFFLEIFAPGGILGIMGAIALVVAAILAYEDWGMLGSAAILLGGALAGILLFFLEIRLITRSPFGKQFQHHHAQKAQTKPVGSDDLVGKRGRVLTTMAPSGKVMIDNKSLEAASEGGLIKKDATVVVIRSEHLKLIVKEI